MKDLGFQSLNGMFRNGFIKSIQRGTITINNTQTSNTATLSQAVDTNNSVLRFLGNEATDGGSQSDRDCVRLSFTNSTTITATRTGSINGPIIASFEVIEHYAGVIRSIQLGTVTIGSGQTSNTATINAVNLSKATIEYLGVAAGGVSQTGQAAEIYHRIALTNSTTVTANRSGTPAVSDAVGFEVIEYF